MSGFRVLAEVRGSLNEDGEPVVQTIVYDEAFLMPASKEALRIYDELARKAALKAREDA